MDLYGWPPAVANHLTITELIFYRTRNGAGHESSPFRMRF